MYCSELTLIYFFMFLLFLLVVHQKRRRLECVTIAVVKILQTFTLLPTITEHYFVRGHGFDRRDYAQTTTLCTDLNLRGGVCRQITSTLCKAYPHPM